eukprot:1280725-Amorphochlora_amoeboformis.AAC.2
MADLDVPRLSALAVRLEVVTTRLEAHYSGEQKGLNLSIRFRREIHSRARSQWGHTNELFLCQPRFVLGCATMLPVIAPCFSVNLQLIKAAAASISRLEAVESLLMSAATNGLSKAAAIPPPTDSGAKRNADAEVEVTKASEAKMRMEAHFWELFVSW